MFVNKRLHKTVNLETRKQIKVYEECAFTKDGKLLITSCL